MRYESRRADPSSAGGEPLEKGKVRVAVEREVEGLRGKSAGYLHPGCANGWAGEQGEDTDAFSDTVLAARMNGREARGSVSGLGSRVSEGVSEVSVVPGRMRRLDRAPTTSNALTDRGETLSTVLGALWDFGETWAASHGITRAPARPPVSDP